ncbi:MAG: NYN domain-containing protein, partial [Oscillospiraceae bacterium]|nr:NYN domain-containing protein [Oscillospiraceae bacterium]
MNEEKRFAILIDGENISSGYIKIILDEISTKGIATYKRIYGDWTKPGLAKWKDILLGYSITPMQQYSYT